MWARPKGAGLWKISADAVPPRLTSVPEFRGTDIWDLHGDTNGDIWIGAKNGLFHHATASQTLIRHRLADTDQLHDQPINVASINELDSGLFLIGAWNQGAYLCEPKPGSRTIEIVAHENGRDTKLLHATSLYNPQDRRLYVPPARGGLYRSHPLDAPQQLAPATDQFHRAREGNRGRLRAPPEEPFGHAHRLRRAQHHRRIFTLTASTV